MLHASRTGSAEGLAGLLDAAVKEAHLLLYQATDSQGMTCLHVAAKNGRLIFQSLCR